MDLGAVTTCRNCGKEARRFPRACQILVKKQIMVYGSRPKCN